MTAKELFDVLFQRKVAQIKNSFGLEDADYNAALAVESKRSHPAEKLVSKLNALSLLKDCQLDDTCSRFDPLFTYSNLIQLPVKKAQVILHQQFQNHTQDKSRYSNGNSTSSNNVPPASNNCFPYSNNSSDDDRFQKKQHQPFPPVLNEYNRSSENSNNYQQHNKRGAPKSDNKTHSASDFVPAASLVPSLAGKKNHSPPSIVGQGPQKKQKFVSPVLAAKKESAVERESSSAGAQEPTKIKGVDDKLVETIMNDIMDRNDVVEWDDIAGLEHAKNTIKEIVVWPMLRPDIFTGLRGPPKGLLLFGPPGTGKTLIGKCIASQSNAKFFSISSSSLTSKWVGEGEKMVRALFAVARHFQPSVIFLDEIDSLLTQRTDGEVEASRRIKTEFLVQFDGCGTNSEDRILMIGATNRPQEIDEAARRRFRKKLYIPLPEDGARHSLVTRLIAKQDHALTESDVEAIVQKTAGYSGSDMDGLVREAALGPIRDIKDIMKIDSSEVRPISFQDFLEALTQVRASVSDKDLELYSKWDQEYGSMKK